MKLTEILQVIRNNYTLGARFFKKSNERKSEYFCQKQS
jgi:hypothetical protein